MEKIFKIPGVTNQDRLIVREHIALCDEDQNAHHTMALSFVLVKGIETRFKQLLALIEQHVNEDNLTEAGKVIGAGGIFAASMLAKFKMVLESPDLNINDSTKEALKGRIAGSEMGLSIKELKDFYGDLPEF